MCRIRKMGSKARGDKRGAAAGAPKTYQNNQGILLLGGVEKFPGRFVSKYAIDAHGSLTFLLMML